jgi:D-alanyl-lipoteichoic acid acyltransferase DltB (MBOAT superfamily)
VFFNSLHFVVFFGLVVVGFFLLPHRWRWGFLLAASYYFYACWKVEYLALILASTAISWGSALRMAATSDPGTRRRYLVLSLVTNLGLLFVFKYFNFFNDSLGHVVEAAGLRYPVGSLDVLLPVGISFYTFQTLSYSVAVYQGQHPPERHPGIFALYVAFFPQLVAGPIERSRNLLPQLWKHIDLDTERIASGLKIMAWGMFKKVVIADRLAMLVNTVYDQPESFLGPQLALATVFFAFQIYCDFSGYSDIAIGAARVLGVELMQNFDRPYHARSIGEFWRRWHISLSTWFRDYVYLPLGGNRVARWRWTFNLLVTFVVSGLWHGANWTFVVWGALNGLYLVAEILLARPRAALLQALRLEERSWAVKIPSVLLTFTLTCLAWVFFRADNVSDALHILTRLPVGTSDFLHSAFTLDLAGLKMVFKGLGLSSLDLGIALGSLAVLETGHLLQRAGQVEARLARLPRPLRWAGYYALIAAILFLGAFNQSQQFIYFQF